MAKELKEILVPAPKLLGELFAKSATYYDERFHKSLDDVVMTFLDNITTNEDEELIYEEDDGICDVFGNQLLIKDYADLIQEEVIDFILSKFAGYTYFQIKCTGVIGLNLKFEFMDFHSHDKRYK